MQKQKVISRETGVEDQQYKWGFEFDIESDIPFSSSECSQYLLEKPL